MTYHAFPGADLSKLVTSLKPGDELFIHDGRFLVKGAPLYVPDGSADQSILVSAYPGCNPIIDGSGITTGQSVVGLGNYCKWNGVHIENSKGHGLSAWEKHDVLITNASSTNTVLAGIMVGSSAVGRSARVTIENCLVKRCCTVNASRAKGTTFPPAIQFVGVDDVTVLNVHSRECYGEGLGFCGVRGGAIWDSSFLDTNGGVHLDNVDGVVMGGIITGGADPAYYRFPGDQAPPFGLCLSGESYQKYPVGLKNIRESSPSVWGGRVPVYKIALGNNPPLIGSEFSSEVVIERA